MDSFLGIKFGDSMESAKQTMLTREGCILNEKESGQNELYFEGVKFAGRNTSEIVLLFFENKFCKALVYIPPLLEAYLIQTYKEIKDTINSKYYISEDDFEIYEYPYEKDDNHTITGIASGNISFSCYWIFDDKLSNSKNSICAEITVNLEIVLSYEHWELNSKRVDFIQNENNKDF